MYFINRIVFLITSLNIIRWECQNPLDISRPSSRCRLAVMDRRGGHVSTLVPHKIAPAKAKVGSQERKMQRIQKYKNKSTKFGIAKVTKVM